MSKVLKQMTHRGAETSEGIALDIAIAFGIALSGCVVELLIYVILPLLAVGAAKSAIAQSASSAPTIMLQSGIEKEDVDGDLKSAMSIYEKIAADATAPRDVRAKALLRLAGCDEKLGKQAKQVYEQIVREYFDQPAAAQARTRLAAIRQQEHPTAAETMSVRKVDAEKLGYLNAWNTDGHHASYIGPDGNLYFGDISGHTKNLVYGSTDPEFRKSPAWFPSRDFSMVALVLPKTNTRPTTLAVVKMDGTGYRELLKDESNVYNMIAPEWSWDDRSLLVLHGDIQRPNSKDTWRIWIFSVADGKRRELVHEESGMSIENAALSPDGQFAAYEVWPIVPFPQGATSKVFVVPMQGGEPRLVYESDPWLDNTVPFGALLDWTPDGRYLAINGNHGNHALLLLPMKNGGATGSAVFVRVGDFKNAWVSMSGALIFEDLASTFEGSSWHLASVDPDGKIGKWTRIEPNQQPYFSHPSFSPDASQIAYAARNRHSTGTDLIVREIATGKERVVYQSPVDGLGCQYSADRPVVFCTSRIGNGKTDLLSVTVDSGAVEQIATFPVARYLDPHPPDGKVFYLVNEVSKGYANPKVRWDRSTQKETIVADPTKAGEFVTLSFDGRWVLRQLKGNLSFRPMSGGDWKTLASGIENYNMLRSTPDGNWALYMASDPQGNPGIYEAPFSGGEPRRVGDLPTNYSFAYGQLVFSPDGRKILATDFGPPAHSLWILENFGPKLPK